ncbi:ribosomal RNA-processing protein 7 homolog A-like [Limulus polyphemus]|uniref:Ribosomal RNA-processing protein 7 homolog A-like n=1 Tax=Limulus polyphemus TaxID=6850 RepID=A0ABM1B0L1_LIMPO|nr:ribosomal RNA-processing protein 7 homolog A-like [Limulus polyphemus]
MATTLSSSVVNSGGFVSIPIKFSEKSNSKSYLFCKDHRVRERHECKPQDRTLFVANVPSYCDKECMKNIFRDCGIVEQVLFHKKPTAGLPAENTSNFFINEQPIKGYKVAYIVFKKPSGLRNALNLMLNIKASECEPQILSPQTHLLPVGIKKWCQEYNDKVPDIKALKEEIDTYMSDFDKIVEGEKNQAKQMEGVPDEEGWITVTKHGKKSVAPRTDTYQKKVLAKEKKKRSQKELLNFYTFQVKQSKMEHLAELRKKFEEDKQRIALMKAAKSSRKFKPY